MDYNNNEVEGIDSGVSDDAFEQDPALEQYQTEAEQAYWKEELTASRKEREKFVERGIETVKRYADDRGAKGGRQSRFNIFYSNTDIKLSSLYARTPNPDIKRRFNDSTDQVSRVAANLLQRNISYELECEGFDPKFKQMLFDRLVPGVGLGWIRLDQEESDVEVINPATQLPATESQVTFQLADIDYVAWDDFLWAPCRVWTDCRWVGRRVPMSKAAIKRRFAGRAPEGVLDELAYSVKSELAPTKGADSLRPKHVTQATVDVYELWDKERALIFWIAESCSLPLDVQRDTNEFPDFFPTPLPPLCRTTTSSTTPISDYSLVQDLYNELDDLNNRAARLVEALQLKYVYDASNEALKKLYTTTAELEGIGVKDWTVQATEKGGIRGSIEFVPLDEIAASYMKLVTARDMVKAQIMEVEGISDFLRGVQQPYVTAAAANATGQASTSRLSVMQMEVADYIQRLLRLKAHIICKFYLPNTILERAGSLPDADQQYVGPALQLLANEQARHFRLEVSVDSIQQINWNQDKADKNELAHSITALMSQIIPAAQQNPGLLPMGISLMKFMVSGYKGSKEFEGTLDDAMKQMIADQALRQQQPPKPTPQELKSQGQQAQIQADLQITAMQEETKKVVAGMQSQIKQLSLQVEAMNAATKAKSVDAAIVRDRAKLHIDALDAAHVSALDVADLGVA